MVQSHKPLTHRKPIKYNLKALNSRVFEVKHMAKCRIQPEFLASKDINFSGNFSFNKLPVSPEVQSNFMFNQKLTSLEKLKNKEIPV